MEIKIPVSSPFKKRFIIFASFALAFSAIYLGYLLILDAIFESKLDKIRKAGYPTNTEELDKFYTKIPDSENVAVIYEEAFANYQNNPPTDIFNQLIICGVAPMPSDTEALDQEKKDIAIRYLAENSKALELLRTAAKVPKARFKADFISWNNKHLSNLRQGARLLGMEGVISLENSDSAKFVQCVKDSVSLGCSLDDEPVIISTLVQRAIQSVSLSNIQRALARNDFTDEQLHEMYDAFCRYEEYRTLQRAFIGERCFVKYFDKFDICYNTTRMGKIRWYCSKIIFRVSGLRKINCIGYLNIINETVGICSPPPEEMLRRSKEIQKRISELPAYMSACKNISFSLMNGFNNKCLGLADVACKRAALAVERYRLKYGKLPENLSDLKGEFIEKVPLDPFDGKELRYRKLPKGYMIYSIGRDCVDNGGTPDPGKNIGYLPGTDTTIMVAR